MDDLTGRLIRGYQLHERIGEGRSGVVYRGSGASVEREVAVKIIRPQLANKTDFIQGFERKVQLLTRLEHPHISPIFNYWHEANEAAIVSRLFPGGNLLQAVRRQPFGIEAAARVVMQISGALHVAHLNGVIHRNVKPENVLFDEDGGAYLADFGSILAVKTDGANGSSHYQSPEQRRGDPLSPAADVYSLGVMLYELVTGAPPRAAQLPMLPKSAASPLLPAVNLTPDISEAVMAVLRKATSESASARYQDVQSFAAAFRDATRIDDVQHQDELVGSLTLREQEVLYRLVEGKSNNDIAQELFISVATVKWYNKQIYDKLHVRSRVQAIIRARELRLIPAAAPSGKQRTGETAIQSPALEPVNPYKGLLAFRSADSQDFFGRESLIRTLLDLMGDVRLDRAEGAVAPTGQEDYSRFLAVVGPSGSGKSSLVKAGLIPSLWRGDLLKPEHWFVVDMIPGNHPIDNLEAALAKVAPRHDAEWRECLRGDPRLLPQAAQTLLPVGECELVIVIDQFEEIFTLPQEEVKRAQFLDGLVAATIHPQSRVRIVITLRADFYDRPLQYPEFGKMVRSRMVTVLPLTVDELARAITRPAERVGVAFEPGLLATIIAEVKDQPGALPLLQFTLTELFEHRSGLVLTREAYVAIGGVSGALARQADKTYDELPQTAKEAARTMFLRLITLGEGVEDTRRRVPRSELLAIAVDTDVMDDLIDTYAGYRLLSLDHDPTTHAPTVEIAHEALIRVWGRLGEWLAESREDLRVQRRLMASATQWIDAKRDPSFLAAGGHLMQYEAVAAGTRVALGEDERAFLSASVAARNQRDAEREVQQKRLLRMQRAVIGVLIMFLLTATMLSIVAFTSRTDALSQTRIAVSGQLAAQAVAELRNPIGDDEYAALMAIRALRSNYSAAADSALVEAASRLPLKGFIGHTDVVYDVAYSADGRFVLTGSGDRTARLWESTTGSLVRTFSADGAAIYSVAFSADGKYILTGGGDGTARLWEVATGVEVRQFVGHAGEVHNAAFSPDGEVVATTCEDEVLRLFDTNTGQLLRTLSDTQSGWGVAFSPDGQYIVASEAGNSAALWELRTGYTVRTFRGNSDSIFSLAFSPDGAYILAGSLDNTATLWETATGREVHRLQGHSSSVRDVAFSPDGRYMLTGSSDHTARLWEMTTGQEVHRFRAHLGRIWGIAFSPDGNYILTGSADHTAKLWQTVMDNEIATLRGHQDAVYDVAFSPTGNYAVTASADSTIILWDVTSGQEVHRFAGHEDAVFGVAVSPDGTYMLSGSSDGTARLWDMKTGQAVYLLNGHEDRIFGVAFSPDGAYALTGSADNTAILWDIGTGEQVHTLRAHNGDVAGVAFSPDGRFAATASDDGTVILWAVLTGLEVWSIKAPTTVYGVEFFPDGKHLLTGGVDGAVQLWMVENGQEVRDFDGADNTVYNVAFSPDGKYILGGCANRTAIMWDVATGSIVRILRGHRSAVWGVAFSPDGEFVLTGGLDGTASLWPSDYRDLVTVACARLLRDFTSAEREGLPIKDEEPTCPAW